MMIIGSVGRLRSLRGRLPVRKTLQLAERGGQGRPDPLKVGHAKFGGWKGLWTEGSRVPVINRQFTTDFLT